MWERLRGTAKGRRFYTTLSEQERKEWPIMLLLGYCKKLRLLTPLEEFETTPKVYTTVASYLDKFLPPPLNTFRVVWAICSLVFLLSLLFHRGSVILNLRAMLELGGMKRRPSEAFTLEGAEREYGSFVDYLQIDKPTTAEAKQAFLPELWPTRCTPRSWRLRDLFGNRLLGWAVPPLPWAPALVHLFGMGITWWGLMARTGWHQAMILLYTDYTGDLKVMVTQRLLERTYDFLNRNPTWSDAQCKAGKSTLFSDICRTDLPSVLTPLQRLMILALRRILRGGGANADDGRALEHPTGFRIPFSREALLLHLFLTAQPLLKTPEEQRRREEREERERQRRAEAEARRTEHPPRRRRRRRQAAASGEMDRPQETGRDYQNKHGRSLYLPFSERNRKFVRIDAVIWKCLMAICGIVVNVPAEALQPAGRSPMLSDCMGYSAKVWNRQQRRAWHTQVTQLKRRMQRGDQRPRTRQRLKSLRRYGPVLFSAVTGPFLFQSFLTDGVSVRILLFKLRNLAAYVQDPPRTRAQVDAILGRGQWRPLTPAQRRALQAQRQAEVEQLRQERENGPMPVGCGLDPGMAKIYTVSRRDTRDPSERPRTLTYTRRRHYHDIHVDVFSQWHQRRLRNNGRVQSVQDKIAEVGGFRHLNIDKFCAAMCVLNNNRDLWDTEYLYAEERAYWRMDRFRAKQSALDRACNRIFRFCTDSKCSGGDLVIVSVGDAKFGRTPKGSRSVPTSKFTRTLLRVHAEWVARGWDIRLQFVDEYRTTKCCWRCGRETVPMMVCREDDRTGRSHHAPSMRLRVCPDCSTQALDQNSRGGLVDRDVNASRHGAGLSFCTHYEGSLTARPDCLNRAHVEQQRREAEAVANANAHRRRNARGGGAAGGTTTGADDGATAPAWRWRMRARRGGNRDGMHRGGDAAAGAERGTRANVRLPRRRTECEMRQALTGRDGRPARRAVEIVGALARVRARTWRLRRCTPRATWERGTGTAGTEWIGEGFGGTGAEGTDGDPGAFHTRGRARPAADARTHTASS
ncbi:hypothetical protein CDCA_CDCA07G2218 [Cyanidium caldarium]|uniref:Transposase n=1 Tax=Cyanidium caldarium TaxID=2771 RepID=A0AAV9IWL2_CYACA|nr:hypothetical protein CDCA_CDCA07G2218 [Cyanidium caldarium]